MIIKDYVLDRRCKKVSRSINYQYKASEIVIKSKLTVYVMITGILAGNNDTTCFCYLVSFFDCHSVVHNLAI